MTFHVLWLLMFLETLSFFLIFDFLDLKKWFCPFIGFAVPPPPKSSHPKNPLYIAEGFWLGYVSHKMVKTDFQPYLYRGIYYRKKVEGVQ